MATINGTFNSLIGGTISGTVGTPGPQGPAGPAGAQGIPGPGVPVGGTAGQFLTKTTTGVDYATNWSTLSLAGYATESWVTAGFYPLSGNPSGFLTASALTPYLTKADNLGSLTNFSLARDNLGLGSLNTPTFSGVNIPGAGTSVANLGATSLTINQQGSGQFTIQPSQGIVFPNGTIQTTAFTGAASASWGSITGTLSSQTDLQTALNLKSPLASPAFTGTPTAPTPSPGTDSTQIATTAWVKNFDYAPTNSPTLTGNPKSVTPNLADDDTSIATTAFVKGQNYLTSSALTGYALLSGATFSGKVNLASLGVGFPSFNLGGQCDPAPASAANGDLWISNAAAPKITYRTGGINYNLAVLNQFNTFTGQMVINTTSSVAAALRVTQLGTANAIEVEDSTTPDATRFVVDQHGKVGIGVAPDTTAALKVDTNGIMFGDGTTQTTAAVSPPPALNVTALWMAYNYIVNTGSMSYDSYTGNSTVNSNPPFGAAFAAYSGDFYLFDNGTLQTFGIVSADSSSITFSGDLTGRTVYAVTNASNYSINALTRTF